MSSPGTESTQPDGVVAGVHAADPLATRMSATPPEAIDPERARDDTAHLISSTLGPPAAPGPLAPPSVVQHPAGPLTDLPITTPKSNSRSLFRDHDFRQLWIGDTGSQLGAAVASLAVPFLAITALNATPFQMGLLSTLSGIGFLVIGLPAGALVDRRSKRKVMMSADIGRALLLTTLPVAWWLDVLTLAQVMTVSTLVGMLTVFFDVSYQSYLPFLVRDDQIVDGNAKLQASQSVSQSAGPALGGFLLKLIGAPLVILANAGGYLVSAVFLRRIRHREVEPSPSSRRPLVIEISEGLKFVVHHRLLRRLIACTAIGNFTSSAGAALVVLYMLKELHLSTFEIGLIDSVFAAGGLAGALLAGALARRIGEGASIIFTASAVAVFTFANPLASVLPAIPTLMIGGVAMGAASVAYNIATVSFRQRLCPPELLGRMNASARFLVWGTIPIGAFIGGVLGTHLGVLSTLWLSAAAGCLAVLPVASRSLWAMRKLPEHEEVTTA